MSLAIIINSAYPRPGGVETHVRDKVSALRGEGFQIYQYSLAPKQDVGREESENLVISRFRMKLAFGSVMSFPPLGTTRRIISELRNQSVSGISTHTRFFPMTFVGYKVSKALGVPWIHSEHGSSFVRTQNPLVDIPAKMWDLTLGKFLLRKADVVVADSEFVADFVEQLAGVEAVVLENPIQIDTWFRPNNELNKEIKSFVFAGRLVSGKGWDTFLELVANASKQNPNLSEIPIHIFGHGPDAEKAISLSKTLGLNSRIQMHGNVTPDTLREFFLNSIYINASVLSEGFQITVLEATAAGARVVTFDVPSAISLLKEGAQIWVAPKGNYEELSRLILEASEARFLPPKIGLFSRWSWSKWVEEYIRVLNKQRNLYS